MDKNTFENDLTSYTGHCLDCYFFFTDETKTEARSTKVESLSVSQVMKTTIKFGRVRFLDTSDYSHENYLPFSHKISDKVDFSLLSTMCKRGSYLKGHIDI